MTLQKTLTLSLFLIISMVFAVWLMFHTFSFSDVDSQLLISAKAWSDFGSHLPLVRSFSHGANWPPQHPLFSGEPIRYHYLFYFTVGILERLGMRIDYALNIPSALGFISLICLIVILSSRLFGNILTGILSGIFFFFNSTFSFLDFFTNRSLSLRTLGEIVSNTSFPSFGPWNGSLITAFWNLNIYTNQRHLGLSFAILLLAVYLLHFPGKRTYLVGFLLGSLALVNQAAFLIGSVFYIWYFIWNSKIRRFLLISAWGSLPWVLILFTSMQISPQITFQPGYLVSSPISLDKFMQFWLFNLGINAILIPLSFILAPSRSRPLIVPLVLIFTIANLWKFSPDMINNHKFFNLFVIISSMYTANLLAGIFKIKFIGPLLTFALALTLTLGGLVDLFPVINDRYLSVSDAPVNSDVNYFLSLPNGSVVLNSFWFYHPASLAGKSIYQGYSYFTWSYGYDQIAREKSAVNIYASRSKIEACSRLLSAGVDYLELSPAHESFIIPNYAFWQKEFIPDYINPQTRLVAYSVSRNCANL